jgi:gamma-butyrobetaine dioxygenase
MGVSTSGGEIIPEVAMDQTKASPRSIIRAADLDDGRVTVNWEDGHESRFHPLWLRYNCDCEDCGQTNKGLRPLRLTDIPRDIAVTTALVDGQGQLALTWSDGHQALFEPDWLRARCYSSAEREYRRFKPILWGPELSDAIPRCDYGKVRADEAEHLRLLEHLRDYGFVHLRGAPIGPDVNDEITGLVGTLRVTNYGSSYEFIAKPTPLVQGDTGTKLEPHTDEPYRYWPPAITFFQVFKASEDGGGASILVDAFRVAEVLRQRNPDAFHMLSHAPQTFHRDISSDRTESDARDFRCAARIFSLDFEGNLAGFRLLDRGAGPLDLPEHMIEPYFDALRLLLEILYDEAEQLSLPLVTGDVLIFNNQRVLHGREAFDRGEGGRHLRTSNVDLDEFHSRLRVLARRLGRDSAHMSLPAGATA